MRRKALLLIWTMTLERDLSKLSNRRPRRRSRASLTGRSGRGRDLPPPVGRPTRRRACARSSRPNARRLRAGRRKPESGVASLLLAGVDHNGPQLYQIDPSGSYFAWKASAIGKHMVNAKTFLEKRYTNELELEDAVHTALLTLKEGFEGAMDHTNIEVGIVGADKTFKVLTPEEVKDYLGEVE